MPMTGLIVAVLLAQPPPQPVLDSAGSMPVPVLLTQAEPELVVWYGWQVILVDLAAMTGVVLAGVRDDSRWLPPSLALAAVGPAGLHFLHGRPASAGRSVAFRLGAVCGGAFAGGLIGLLVPVRGAMFSSASAALYGGAIGAGLGYLGAASLDATELSPLRPSRRVSGDSWASAQRGLDELQVGPTTPRLVRLTFGF